MPERLKPLLNSKPKLFAVGAVILILLIILVARVRVPTAATPKVSPATTSANPTVELDKTYSFPMKDNQGQVVTNISYTITSAQLLNQIIVQGQTATAAPGRIFLILNLKLRNDSNQAVSLNTGDYIRLSVNNGTDWLAADIHNDPVVVQPISTKLTRLGFPVNVTDKKFLLQVGEIKGEKSTVPLEFK